jgi:cytochrome c553|tara:strand:+ start:690 stop:1070 length:381 start_codon:yes stop_codon:yes gene_type:complete
MKSYFLLSLFFGVFLNSNLSFAEVELTAQLKVGKEKVQTICSACHGLDGVAASGGNSVIIPNLTAQNKDYLIAKLKDYKSGKVNHPQMTLIAQMLTDDEIEYVSEWYSRIKITIFDPNLILAKPSK